MSSFRFSRANFAITVPWNGSMKQTRKTYGRTLSSSFVTRGLVEDGEIIGTRWRRRPGAMASERRRGHLAEEQVHLVLRDEAGGGDRRLLGLALVVVGLRSAMLLALHAALGVPLLDGELDAVVGGLRRRWPPTRSCEPTWPTRIVSLGRRGRGGRPWPAPPPRASCSGRRRRRGTLRGLPRHGLRASEPPVEKAKSAISTRLGGGEVCPTSRPESCRGGVGTGGATGQPGRQGERPRAAGAGPWPGPGRRGGRPRTGAVQHGPGPRQAAPGVTVPRSTAPRSRSMARFWTSARWQTSSPSTPAATAPGTTSSSGKWAATAFISRSSERAGPSKPQRPAQELHHRRVKGWRAAPGRAPRRPRGPSSPRPPRPGPAPGRARARPPRAARAGGAGAAGPRASPGWCRRGRGSAWRRRPRRPTGARGPAPRRAARPAPGRAPASGRR